MGLFDGLGSYFASGGNDYSGLISTGIDLISGFAGRSASAGDRDTSRQMMAEAFNVLNQLGLAPDESKEIIYREFSSAGDFTPEMEQDLGQIHSEMSQYKESPEAVSAGLDALQKYKDLSRTGMSIEDELALSDIRDRISQEARSQKASALEEAQRANRGGSGAELMASLNVGNAAASRLAKENMAQAAQAQNTRIAALGKMAQQASDIRRQGLDYANATLGAEDKMAEFNMRNSIARQAANVGARNRAMEQNVTNRQNIANANVKLRNTELQRQSDARRQNYLDELERRKAMANAYTGRATDYSNSAKETEGVYSGVGKGLGQIATSIFKPTKKQLEDSARRNVLSEGQLDNEWDMMS